MSKSIKGSEVYWEAALDIFEGQLFGGCYAIFKYTDCYDDRERKLFERFFKDINITDVFWMRRNDQSYSETTEIRVWAMLFMEQIWKDEVKRGN